MFNGGAFADADRLPWLEPYREPARGRTRPVALIGTVAILAAVGGAGYWLGQREQAEPIVAEAPAPQPSRTAVIPLPEPAPLAIPARPPEAEPNRAPPVARAEAQAAADRKAAEPARATVRRGRPARKIPNAGVETARLDAVRRQQERARVAAPAAPPRIWPRMPSPGPAGQVVQLGAFSHPDRAYNAYRQRIASHPRLAAMPRVIVPVVVRPSGRMLYVLRLGTSSRQQSKTLCRNLRRSGDHCIVIG